MVLKKVWMSPDTGRKSRYGLYTLGGILTIAVLMVALVVGGVFLSFWLDLPREAFAMALVCGVTALAVALALKLGWRSVGDATVFFLTDDDRLFAVDARARSVHGQGVLNYAAGALETQAFLRALAAQPHVPGFADEIRHVSGIKETGTYYAIRCQVCRCDHRTALRTYFLVKGNEDEELLLRHLERRQVRDGSPELRESRTPLFILISVLVLAAFLVLCTLSHPALGVLPQSIYFPCLGAAFLTLFLVAYFIIRQRRGE